MLEQVHVRPIAKVEAIGIQAHSVYPRGDNRRHCLMVERKPTDIRNGNLLRLGIERETLSTGYLIRQDYELIKGRIAPITNIPSSRREQIQCQAVIRIGKVCRPLRKAELYLPIGCLRAVCGWLN